MSDQRHDQLHGQQQQDHTHEAPGAGQTDRRQGMDNSERQPGEKPKTERASHQGGGHIRTDHQPQGK